MEIGDKIGGGSFGDIYDVKIFTDKEKITELTFPTPLCMKIQGITSDETESDKREYDIGLELGNHNIGPKMYDYIVIKDLNVIP